MHVFKLGISGYCVPKITMIGSRRKPSGLFLRQMVVIIAIYVGVY